VAVKAAPCFFPGQQQLAAVLIFPCLPWEPPSSVSKDFYFGCFSSEGFLKEQF